MPDALQIPYSDKSQLELIAEMNLIIAAIELHGGHVRDRDCPEYSLTGAEYDTGKDQIFFRTDFIEEE